MQSIFKIIEEPLMKLSQVLTSNKVLMSIKDAFIIGIPFTVIGSFSGLIKSQVEYFSSDEPNFLIQLLIDILAYINTTTLGMIGVVVVLASSYFYANQLKMENSKINPLTTALISLVAYMVTAPSTIHLPTGESVAGFALQFFNYEGLFSGLVIGLLTARLYNRLVKAKFTIQLHESVPPAIMEAFMAMIPITLILVLFSLVREGVSALGFDHLQAFIQQLIVSPLNSVGTGLPAILIVILLMQLLWFFGLHGFSIMWGVISTLWLPLFLSQIDTFAQTQDYSLITQVAPNTISNIYAMIGGSGSTLALVAMLLLLAPKNSAEHSVAKMSSVPGLFNINEPIIFGLPIVLNPMMFIPFVCIPLFNAIVAYFAISTGLVAPMIVLNAGVEPVLLNAFVLGNFNLSPVLLMLGLFIVDCLLYAPFVKMLIKQRKTEELTAQTA